MYIHALDKNLEMGNAIPPFAEALLLGICKYIKSQPTNKVHVTCKAISSKYFETSIAYRRTNERTNEIVNKK